ncbi:MAG: protein phosphatase 2C domain-containing protein [Roseivirga sp.]
MIKTHTTLNIGHFHTNYCEDFWVTAPITSSQQLIAVLDGCTMGTESAFAAMLFGKTLRSIARELYYEDFLNPSGTLLSGKLREIFRGLFSRLKSIRNQLSLDTHELLTTIVLGVLDQKSRVAEFLTIGDGLICHDGNIVNYEQDDRPDYLGYHLSKDFDSWFDAQTQKLTIKSFNDLSICTDGIFSFRNFKQPAKQKSEAEIIDFLLINDQLSEHNNCLERKMRIVQQEWQHEVTDDLAIVRIVSS